jgi:hypothetical protein
MHVYNINNNMYTRTVYKTFAVTEEVHVSIIYFLIVWHLTGFFSIVFMNPNIISYIPLRKSSSLQYVLIDE